MRTTEVDGHRLDYDVTGDGPTLLLVSGWCQDHRLFDAVVPELSRQYRVIRADWRGHGRQRAVAGDFGVDEQADDLVALLDTLGVTRFVPVSTSHGGWANVELVHRLGADRVPRAVLIDWIMTEAPAEFVDGLREIQDPTSWLAGRQRLFDHWLGGTEHPEVARHLGAEMASFGFDMWARSCRVIERAYAEWGSPLRRMATIHPARPIMHLYAQPAGADYEQAQSRYAAEHPWFLPCRLAGRTHFPTLESPGPVAERIDAFVREPGG